MFEQEYGSWDADTMTYCSAGENSIVVRGVDADAVAVYIGDKTGEDLYEQLKNDSAFAGFASQSIFS